MFARDEFGCLGCGDFIASAIHQDVEAMPEVLRTGADAPYVPFAEVRRAVAGFLHERTERLARLSRLIAAAVACRPGFRACPCPFPSTSSSTPFS